MSGATTFTLPWPTSANAMYARTRSGGVRLTKDVHAFREEVWLARNQQGVRRWEGTPLDVHITAHPPDDDNNRDLDNLLKPLLDALEHALIIDDDVMVDILTIERGAPSDPPLVVVTISEYASPRIPPPEESR